MWRFGYDTTASFLLILALLSMLAAVIVWQQHRTGKAIVIWLWATIFGVFLGGAGTLAISKITEGALLGGPAAAVESAEVGMEHSAEGPGGGMGGGGGGMGGGGMGAPGGGMGRGGGGMFGGPRPKRDLASVVRKVALLTGDVGIGLSADQTSALIAALKDIEQPETMTDEEAQAKHDAILALLDENQKTQLEAIGLPRGPRPGGGPGGERPPEDANPFGEEANSAALAVLRQRFPAP